MKLRSPALLLTLAFALSAPALRAQETPPSFTVKNELLPSPAAPGSFAPRLINAPDGAVYLSWMEPTPDHRAALRFSRFDATAHTWSSALTIGEIPALALPPALAPRLAVASPRALAALSHPSAVLALVSTSADGGANWSRPVPLNRPHRPAAGADIQPLPDGRFLAAWIEPSAGGGTAVLLARTTSPGTAPIVVDPSVSPAGAPALVVFPDGSALAAYRGLDPGGVCALRTARFQDGRWDTPAPLGFDDWKPAAPPDAGPALVARGIHVAAAWFTAASGPRVNVSASDNAGAQWLLSNRVDDTAPLPGRPALVLFDDGSQLVSWVETAASGPVVLLRRISGGGNLSVPVPIGPIAQGAAPSLARVKDGDTTPAQLLVACLRPAPGSQPSTLNSLAIRLITLPDPDELAADDPCGCDPRPEDLRGYPIKGRVVAIDPVRGTVRLDHEAILGVMKAGTTTVQAAPEVLRIVRTGRLLLARVERTGADWTLFNVRLLAPLPSGAR